VDAVAKAYDPRHASGYQKLRACSLPRIVILLLPTKGVLVDVPLYVRRFMYDASVPVFLQMLNNLSAVLDKARHAAFDAIEGVPNPERAVAVTHVTPAPSAVERE
jgi:hypothetical protein